MPARELRTERLLLRAWRPDDLEPFAALNADAEAMRYFPQPYDRDESAAQAERFGALLDERGWGLWAVEVPGVAPFVGFTGLHRVPFEAHFTPAVEIGWRLWRPYFGRGYASEAALAALAFGFEELGLREIVAYTATANEPSRRVMERIGMTYDPVDDFDNPRLAAGHPLRRHVLYRRRAAEYET